MTSVASFSLFWPKFVADFDVFFSEHMSAQLPDNGQQRAHVPLSWGVPVPIILLPPVRPVSPLPPRKAPSTLQGAPSLTGVPSGTGQARPDYVTIYHHGRWVRVQRHRLDDLIRTFSREEAMEYLEY